MVRRQLERATGRGRCSWSRCSPLGVQDGGRADVGKQLGSLRSEEGGWGGAAYARV